MNAPFRIKGLDHVVLRATNISSMKRFYCDILGCVLERAQPDLGLYQLRAGHSLIDLVDMQGELGRAGGKPPGIEGRNMDHFCIGIDPFQECELRAHLKAHGIPCHLEVYPDLAHEYPPDFEVVLARALEYILQG